MNEIELVEFIKERIKEAPALNLEEIISKDYVLAHAVSCIRHRTTDEKTVKFEVWEDLEEYFRVILDTENRAEDETMSIAITHALIKWLEIDAHELQRAARLNAKETIKIRGLQEVLMQGMAIEMHIPDETMYVAECRGGASVILFDDVLQRFCEEHDVDEITILPSSINEVILVTEKADGNDIDDMVSDVNKKTLREEEVLSDHAYYYHKK